MLQRTLFDFVKREHGWPVHFHSYTDSRTQQRAVLPRMPKKPNNPAAI